MIISKSYPKELNTKLLCFLINLVSLIVIVGPLGKLYRVFMQLLPLQVKCCHLQNTSEHGEQFFGSIRTLKRQVAGAEILSFDHCNSVELQKNQHCVSGSQQW